MVTLSSGNRRATQPSLPTPRPGSGRRAVGQSGRIASARGGIRTPDLCLRRATLYPAELRAPATANPLANHAAMRTDKGTVYQKWSGRLDLNQRPPAPEAGALPGYATPRRPYSSTSQAMRPERVELPTF